MRLPTACIIIRRPFFDGHGLLRRVRRSFRKLLIGEVAERSKALDWNSSNISTGVRGFESHPLRHHAAQDHGGPHWFLRDDQS
jgi:hypothetical protein